MCGFGASGQTCHLKGGPALSLERRLLSEVLRMRRSPSIVPETADRDIYQVLDDFGRLGRSWREIDEERTGRETRYHRFDGWSSHVGSAIRSMTFEFCLPTRATAVPALEWFHEVKYDGYRLA
jgi:ATP-dependent DNA ligase